jgi:hypothetical protein
MDPLWTRYGSTNPAADGARPGSIDVDELVVAYKR